ncbi:MAG: hypothetical protein ACKVP4_00115 [Hyphomicrobium sp.]
MFLSRYIGIPFLAAMSAALGLMILSIDSVGGGPNTAASGAGSIGQSRL